MILRSLAGRLLLASAILLPIFLGLTGYFLDRAFQQSLYTAESERLKTYIYLLLGSAEMQGNTLVLPTDLQVPGFSQLQSGLYGVISNSVGEVWRSDSARLLPSDLTKNIKKLKVAEEDFSSLILPAQDLFTYGYAIIWEGVKGKELQFQFTVLHSKKYMQAELSSYQQQLWYWLGIAAALLLVAQFVIMRWGLKPLKKLASDLKQVEAGEKELLNGMYPHEIEPVTVNLNKLIQHERGQQTRYRNTLADLAHSLKTPLAVMRGMINDGLQQDSQQQLLDEQLLRMDDIVSHQLKRAVTHSPALSTKATSVHAVVNRLVLALEKVYHEKAIKMQMDVSTEIHFYGDERDLMEVLGNLLENAFKYGRSEVKLHAQRIDDQLIIHIEDNGPGIPTKLATELLKRGARADTAQSGQGIGLAVVVDIISSYGGSFRVENSDLGGSAFIVSLPAK